MEICKGRNIAAVVLSVAAAAASVDSWSASNDGAASSEEMLALMQALDALRRDYDARIAELETRLAAAERSVRRADKNADNAIEIAEDISIAGARGRSSANAFNPSVGAVLAGVYADVDNGWEAIPGFQPGGEIGPGESGFTLGETEVNLKASIDDLFYGNLTLALEAEDGETEVSIEEAWLETTALARGLTLRAGRQFSGIGYLNSFHRHADDFVDRPLPYQAFLGGQYIADGAQARWVLPTNLFVEIGGELDWGSGFPASGSNGTSPDAWSAFAHVGGDMGLSHSWQAGVSYLSVDADERGSPASEETGAAVFNGDSDLLALDFVWKWAPLGNPSQTSFKLQGEYLRREENGDFSGLDYDGDQTGWYLQGVWQFLPAWRVGYRHDRMDADNGEPFTGTPLEDPASDPSRDTLMVDWSRSEYSRVRFQYVYDQVLPDSENQFYVQYLMSLGAHGAHRF